MHSLIKKIFHPLNQEEVEQQRTGRWVNEFEYEEFNGKNKKFKLDDKILFQEKSILIRQHRRFAPYGLHSHEFLEFNYMYSGTSEQIVNGVPITLKEGQLLLLDTNSSHQLSALGENDILLNFLFRTKDININFLKNIDNHSKRLTYNFLMHTILDPSYNETHLLLDLSRDPEIQVTLEQMILEFLSNKSLGSNIMNSFSQLLFLQLSRVYHSQLDKIYQNDIKNTLIIKIIQKIENDYQTLTLYELANNLGYNRNYLSNLIKQQTGYTFTKLITDQRLHEAQHLIVSTRLPIETISEYVGFSNKTRFYKKYREYYGDTPINIRKKHK